MARVAFIEPMLLQPSESLPEGWHYELKLDGYRAIAFKTGGAVHLRSKNDKDFAKRFRQIADALAGMPDETVIDGEIVALDASGKPSFNALQHFKTATLVYYVFDVMILRGRDVMGEPLTARRALLEEHVLPGLAEPVRYSVALEAPLPALIQSVRSQGLEGLVAKQLDSRYEPGQRSGAWLKMRLNQEREFVIGGYTKGAKSFDALVIGRLEGDALLYVAKTRNGFTPALREQIFRSFAGLEIDGCPFVNLPEAKGGRWGAGLTADKMSECRWLRPVLIGEFEFVEETPDGHLRHPKFVKLTSQ